MRGGSQEPDRPSAALGAYRFWEVRSAQNLKATSYVCPLCDELLHAMSEHMLLVPEGDASRRRHAHSDCVLGARRQGLLPSREEWQRAQTPATKRRRRGA
jgi:hypothetical protein